LCRVTCHENIERAQEPRSLLRPDEMMNVMKLKKVRADRDTEGESETAKIDGSVSMLVTKVQSKWNMFNRKVRRRSYAIEIKKEDKPIPFLKFL
jgi:hypothetical protein